MVRWLKSLFVNKWDKDSVLSFNRTKLQTEINNLSDNLYTFRHEVSWKILREVIEMARNIEILDVNKYPNDGKGFYVHKGRMQALTDLGVYIDNAILGKASEMKDGKTQVRNIIKQPRRTNNQAQTAL